VAITDDGHCVQNNELMRRACEYAKMFDLPVMDHCQDYSLVTDGVMHEGYWSTALGLRGWPAAGEEMIVARNILLAELTGAKIHCQHLSAAGSVALLREAKNAACRFPAKRARIILFDRCGGGRQRKILERRTAKGSGQISRP
jgi:dihydroorotase